MVIRIFKAKNSSFGAGLMFKLIGISNVACCICLSIRWVPKSTSMPHPLLWILLAATMTAYFLQLGFNVSLAALRYQVVTNAIGYFSSEARRRLEKKVSLAVIAVSVLLGVFCTTMRYVLNNLWFLSIPLAISRIIGYIILSVLYIKLYFAMKSNAESVSADSVEGDQPTTCNQSLVKIRRKQLEHSKKFFFGITSSFFVLNLPTMALFFITNQFPNCTAWKGILSQIAIGLSCFNMMFDSVWYFYMDRQSTRSLKVRLVMIQLDQ